MLVEGVTLTFICLFPQTSGEAQYISDIPIQGGELYGAFVVSTQVQLYEYFIMQGR